MKSIQKLRGTSYQIILLARPEKAQTKRENALNNSYTGFIREKDVAATFYNAISLAIIPR